MYNPHHDLFQIRDVVNNIAVGGFKTWDGAAEWCFDFTHNKLDVGPPFTEAGLFGLCDER
jgi:hypothetical protein